MRAVSCLPVISYNFHFIPFGGIFSMGTVASFVIVLGVLIFFHEFGHFIFARLFGVGVEKFSLGFGPKILSKKVGITEYMVSAIPLGGYVKMVGDDPGAEVDDGQRALSFNHKPVLQRFLIVAAGPGFNFLLAFLLFTGIYMASGLFILEPVIGDVKADTPAFAAGLEKGDRVLAVNRIAVGSWEEMAGMIGESGGSELFLTVQRGESEKGFTIVPKVTTSKNLFGEDVERHVIGVTSAGEVRTEELSLPGAVVQGMIQTYNITKLTVVSIAKLVQGTLSIKTVGGPIMIAQMAGEQAEQGTLNFLFFIALLSVNLAILNILPIPVLDGGHMVFFTIEAIMGRPVSLKSREIAQQVGVFLLITLMVYICYNDIARLFS